VGPVALIGKMKNTYKVQSERNSHLGKPEACIGGQGRWGINMQWNFREKRVRTCGYTVRSCILVFVAQKFGTAMWSGFMWLRMQYDRLV